MTPNEPRQPDSTEFFIAEETRLVCAIHPGPMGALNGYVAVPETHPWHGVGYSEHLPIECAEEADPEGYCYEHSPESLIDVHGGITYAGPAGFLKTEAGWWFGFDTAHAGDAVPGLRAFPGDVLRDANYVREECVSMARQLAAVTADNGRPADA